MTECTSIRTRRGFVRGAAATAATAAVGAPFVGSTAAAPLSEVGRWSTVYPWPCVAIHLALLPNGKILTWADDDGVYPPNRLADFSKAFVVTIPTNDRPAAPAVQINNNLTNLFCSGHAFLPDGRLLVVGGHEGRQYYGSADVTIFEHQPRYAWRRQNAPMNGGRWYASATTLGNGEVLVLAGTKLRAGDNNPLPQVWETNRGGGWRNLLDAQLNQAFYPPLFVAPNGKVFCAGPQQATRFLSTAGRGDWTAGPKRTFGERFYGGSTMYDNGKVLLVGGGNPPTATAEVIDLAATAPTWRRTGAMAFARRYCSAVTLADGKVLVVSGSSSPGNDAALARLAPELWFPGTGQWKPMASAAVKRVYHSNAILLPDARVLVAGSGRPKAINGGADSENCEIFEPPYLFQGVRPTITSATARVGYNATLVIQTPNAAAIDTVRLIRLPSATHNVDFNQRASTLQFARGAGVLNAVIPASPNLHPPGHYMVFIIMDGVPSIARIIRIG